MAFHMQPVASSYFISSQALSIDPKTDFDTKRSTVSVVRAQDQPVSRAKRGSGRRPWVAFGRHAWSCEKANLREGKGWSLHDSAISDGTGASSTRGSLLYSPARAAEAFFSREHSAS